MTTTQYKDQILAWVNEAETLAVSDIDFLDIIGKLFYNNYPKMRWNFIKETIIDKGLTYTPTENGECRTTDVVFTPNEVEEFLIILQDYHTMLLHKCLYPQVEEAERIKKIHNDLIDNLEMGGCWDETPEYIEDTNDNDTSGE